MQVLEPNEGGGSETRGLARGASGLSYGMIFDSQLKISFFWIEFPIQSQAERSKGSESLHEQLPKGGDS